MVGVFRGLGRLSALEAGDAGAGVLAISGGHGDELHHVEGDILVAPRTDADARHFFHENSSVLM